jgi:hypothetical protein
MRKTKDRSYSHHNCDPGIKVRREIGLKVLHSEVDSADKQWVGVSRAILPTLLQGSDRDVCGRQTRPDLFQVAVHFLDLRLLFSAEMG